MGGEEASAIKVNRLVRARQNVELLTSAIRNGEVGLEGVPTMMKLVLKEESWRERQIPGKKVARFTRFIDFITAPPLEGIGEKPELIKLLLNTDPEALAMFETAIVGKPGNPTGANGHTGEIGINDNIMNSSPAVQGTSRAYTLRRLAKDRPDLFDRVKEGELSANAAAIEAGFRKKATVLEHLLRWWDKASEQEREAFLRRILLK